MDIFTGAAECSTTAIITDERSNEVLADVCIQLCIGHDFQHHERQRFSDEHWGFSMYSRQFCC